MTILACLLVLVFIVVYSYIPPLMITDLSTSSTTGEGTLRGELNWLTCCQPLCPHWCWSQQPVGLQTVAHTPAAICYRVMIHDGMRLAHYLAVHTAMCVCVQLQ